jgi:hypothetical protein
MISALVLIGFWLRVDLRRRSRQVNERKSGKQEAELAEKERTGETDRNKKASGWFLLHSRSLN